MSERIVLDALNSGDPSGAIRELHQLPDGHECPSLGKDGRLAFARYAHVRAILTDPRFGSAGIADTFLDAVPDQIRPMLAPIRDWALYADPPQHTRLRGLMFRAFGPKHVEQLQPFIQKKATSLLDELEDAGSADFISAFAAPLPVSVIASLLGVPEQDHRMMKAWSDHLILAVEPNQTAQTVALITSAWKDAWAYFEALANEKRKRRDADLLSALTSAEEDGQKLSKEEVVSNCLALLLGGHETVTSFLGSGVYHLYSHCNQRDQLLTDASSVPAAVDELLRYAGPSKLTARQALEDVWVGERKIPRGQRVLLLLEAANRDPDVFDQPHTLNLSRQPNKHLAFGYGMHACFGAALARAQGRVVFPMVLARFPKLRVDSANAVWKTSHVVRAFEHLQVHVTTSLVRA